MSLCANPSNSQMIMAVRQYSNDCQRVSKALTGETDFSLLKDISPQDLTNIFTSLDIKCFERLSVTDIVDTKNPLIQDVIATWDQLCSKVEASVSDYNLLGHLVETIIVSCETLQKP